MKTTDVPQDNGMIADYGHEICYAVDSKGNYQLTPSVGWEAKNIVNSVVENIKINPEKNKKTITDTLSHFQIIKKTRR